MNGAEETDPKSENTTVLLGGHGTLSAELQRAKEQEACLIMIRGTPQGHRFFLNQSLMTIGRDLSAEISVADQGISRKHAQITKNGTEIKISDLGSANGTFVNDKRLASEQTVVLVKEDMVKLGNTILKFLPAGEIEILFYGNLGLAAHTDSLTKVYNKGYLLEALEAEFKRAKALHTDFSLVFFDLDHFKRINDTYGHEAGDLVLIQLTQLIRTQHLRTHDVFARYGGEEFVILLASTDEVGALETAEKIRAGIEHHAFTYEKQRLPVTVSVGVATLTGMVESASTLLRNADRALYQAKQNGRNQVLAFT